MDPHVDDHDHWHDNDLDLLAKLPAKSVRARKVELEKLGIDPRS